MSPTVLRRLLLVLVVALAAWGGLVLRHRGRTDAPAGLTLPALSPDQVDDVTLGEGPEAVRLHRTGAAWTVNGLPASTGAVAAWLGAARDTSAESELIARSSGPHARLGLDSATARRLTVRAAGATLLDLYVGTRGPEFEGFYVRPVGEAASYVLRGDFAEGLARAADEWREKTVAGVAAGAIGSVMVRLGRSSMTLARTGGRWTLAGAPADSGKVAKYLGQFAEIRAAGFPGATDSLDFTSAERELVLQAPNGRMLESLVFDSTESGAFWVRTGDGVVYRLDGATVDRLTTGIGVVR